MPGLEREPLKKLVPDANVLLRLLYRWRDEAVAANRTITRICVAYEPGRDGFWLARWLRACGIECHVSIRRACRCRASTRCASASAWSGRLRAWQQQRLKQAPETGLHPMILLLARVYSVGVVTAELMLRETLSRNLRDRRAVARYVGATGAPDESDNKRREQGLAKAGNARVPHGSRWYGASGEPKAQSSLRKPNRRSAPCRSRMT